MTFDDFEEATQRIRDAKNGIVQSSIIFKNQLTDKPLSLNKRMRFGMGTYMLMTGPPGTGKTALVDAEFVLNPILDHITDPQKYPEICCMYRSMERPSVEKMTKWIAYMMYMATEGETLVDTATLLQHPNKKRLLTEEDIYLMDSLKDHMKEISKYLELLDTDTPEGIKNHILKVLYNKGSYITADENHVYVNGIISDKKYDQVDAFGIKYAVFNFKSGKDLKVTPGFARFFPKKKNQVIMTVNDTVDTITVPEGSDEFKTSNAHTNNMRAFRKAGALGIIDIKQFSKESDKDLRSKHNTNLSVGLADIKGSASLGQNVDIAMSILDPTYFNLRTWGGNPGDGGWPDIDLERYHGTFRLLQIFKNSDGGSLYKMPTIFLGEIGFFHEIPQPKYHTERDYIENNDKFLKHLHPENHQAVQLEAFLMERSSKPREINSKMPF